MTVNLGILTFFVAVGLSVFLWVYRRGKMAVLLDLARSELKKIKRIQESSDAINAETKKKLDQLDDKTDASQPGFDPSPRPPGGGNNAARRFWLRDD